MASYLDYAYKINGIVGTDKTVMQNMETLAGAAASWITYDSHDGKWSVVINQEGTSVASFDDSNIIGSISINGAGLENLYNSVRVEFPHIDLNDEKDYIHDSLPAGDLFPNEIDNVLNIQYDIINDPVQAEYLGLIELKQNRLDLVVQFKTDFSMIGLKAGDLIDITSSTYGFTNRMFRVEKLVESDTDDGNIQIDITAREYDANVYSSDDLYRYIRTNSTGIQTLGNIGVPGTPSVSKIEQDARPRVTISSTTPTGTVDAMEFWYTTDNYTYDENRVYQLLDRIKPSFGNTFPFGNTVTITSDSLSAGNLYVKTRGINGQTLGPFSAPSGFVYTPVQTTNNIDENTSVSSSTGGLVTALGALTLLNNIDNLFSGNTASGSVFSKVFDLFSSNTGFDLRGKAGTLSNVVSKSEAGTLGSDAVLSYNLDCTLTAGEYNSPAPTVPLVFTLTSASTIISDSYINYGTSDDGYSPHLPSNHSANLTIRTGSVIGSGTVVAENFGTSNSRGDGFSDLDFHTIANLSAGTYNLQYNLQTDTDPTTATITGIVRKISSGNISIESGVTVNIL